MAFDPLRAASYVPPVADDDYQYTPDIENEGAFRRGVRAALTRVPGAAYATRGVVRGALGDEEGAARDLRQAAPWLEQAERTAQPIKPISQWTPGDMADAVLGTLGEFSIDIAATAALAGAGALTGAAARGATAAVTGAARGATQRAAAKGVVPGAIAGGAGAAFTQQGGEIGAELTRPEVMNQWERDLAAQRRERARTAPDVTGYARVLDGDTVEIVDDAGNVIDRVRPPGINAADRSQEGYVAATEYLRNMIEGRRVSVVGDKRDRAGPGGRLLGHIYTDDSDQSASERMLSAGQAAAGDQYVAAMPSFYRQLETQGREAPGALPLYRTGSGGQLGAETLAERAARGAPVADIEGDAQSLQDMSTVAVTGMAAAAGLDFLPVVRIANRFMPGSGARIAAEVQRSLGRRVGTEAAKGGAIEATTEGLQTVIQRAVAAEIDSNKEVFGEEGIEEILTAATLGGILGVAGGAIGGLPGPIQARAPEAALQPEVVPAPASQGGAAPLPPKGWARASSEVGAVPVREVVDVAGARLQDGRSVEAVADEAESFEGYKQVWQAWARENPDQMERLRTRVAGKVVTDAAENANKNPARALVSILETPTRATTGRPTKPSKPKPSPKPTGTTEQLTRQQATRRKALLEPQGKRIAAAAKERGQSVEDTRAQLIRAYDRDAAKLKQPKWAATQGIAERQERVERLRRTIKDTAYLTKQAKEQGITVAELRSRITSTGKRLAGEIKTLQEGGTLKAPKQPLPPLAEVLTPRGELKTKAFTEPTMTDERGRETVKPEIIDAWSMGKGTLALHDAKFDADLRFPSGARTDGGAIEYRPPGAEEFKRIPAFELMRTIAENPSQVDVRRLFEAAQQAEYLQRKEAGDIRPVYNWSAVEPGADVDLGNDLGSGLYERAGTKADIFQRVNPLADKYKLMPVNFRITSDPKQTRIVGPEAKQNQRGLMAASKVLREKRGLVPVAKVDNTVYYAKPEDQARFYSDFGLEPQIAEDVNALANIGVFIKRGGGQTQSLNVTKDTRRFKEEDRDGTIGVSMDVGGNGLVQGTWYPESAEAAPGGAKGIWRRPLRIRRTDPETGRTEVREELEGINDTIKLRPNKDLPAGDLGGQIHTLKPVGHPSKRSNMGYQGVLGFEHAAEFIAHDTAENIAGLTPQKALSPKDLERNEANIPMSALWDMESPVDMLGSFNVDGVRAVALGTTEAESGLKPAKFNEKTGVTEQRGEVALLPGTRKALEKRSGQRLVPGKTVLVLHRDPALMNNSASNEFLFVGESELMGEAGPGGLAREGIVVNGKDKVGKQMALDFDGDHLLAYVATELTQPQPIVGARFGHKPFTTKEKVPTPVVEGTQTLDVLKGLAQIHDGLSEQIGKVIMPARKLKEMGVLGDELADLSAFVGQGVISAKKKPVLRKKLRAAMKQLNEEVARYRKQRGELGILSEDLKAIERTPIKDQRAKFEEVIKKWAPAVDTPDAYQPPISPVEQAMVRRMIAVDAFMRQHELYTPRSGKERTHPVLLKEAAERAIARGQNKGREFMEQMSRDYQIVQRYLAALPSEEEHDAERSALYAQANVIRSMIQIQYKLGNVDAAVMINAPLSLTGRILEPKDIQAVFPQGKKRMSLRFKVPEGESLPEGDYMARQLVGEGYEVAYKDSQGKRTRMVLRPTQSDNMPGLTREFMDDAFTFTLRRDRTRKRTLAAEARAAGRTHITEDSEQYIVQRTKARSEATPEAKEFYARVTDAWNEAHQMTGDPGNNAPLSDHEQRTLRSGKRQRFLSELPGVAAAVGKSVGLKRPVEVLYGGVHDTKIREVMAPELAERLLNNEIGGRYEPSRDGKTHYVIFSQATTARSPTGVYHTFAHEMGHAIEFDLRGGSMTRELRSEYNAWRDEWQRKYDAASDEAARGQVLAAAYNSNARTPGAVRPEDLLVDGKYDVDYALSYDEWFAENVAAWFRTSARPKTMVELYFKQIANMVRKLFEAFKKDTHLPGPAQSVEAFMDSIWDDSAQVDLASDVSRAADADARTMAEEDVVSEDLQAEIDAVAGEVEALPTRELPEAHDVGLSILKANLYRDEATRRNVLTMLAYRMQGTDTDRMAAFVGVYNHLLTSEERSVVNSLLTPWQRRRLARKTGDARIEQDDTYALAKMFLMWSKGELAMGPDATSTFQKLLQKLMDILGIVSQHKRVDDVFRFLRDGENEWSSMARKLANPRVQITENRQQRGNRLQSFVGAAREVLDTVDNVVADYVKPGYVAVKSNSIPAMRELSRWFHNDIYAVSGEPTIHEASLLRRSEFSERYLEEIESLLPEVNDRVAVIEHLSAGTTPREPNVRKAVARLRALFDDMRNYARVRGIDLGKQRNYFPWVFDTEALKDNPTAFKQLLIRHAPETFWRKEVYYNPATRKRELRDKPGINPNALITPQMKQRGAEQVYFSIVNNHGSGMTDFNDAYAMHTPYMGAQETRILDFIPQSEVLPFISQDLNNVVLTYIDQLVNRAEFTRRAGLHGERVNELLERARRQGATDADIERAQRFIDGNMGVLGYDRPLSVRLPGFTQGMMAFQNFRLLGLSGLTAMTDVAGLNFRRRDMTAVVSGLRKTLQDYKDKGGDLAKLSRSVGAASNAAVEDALTWSYNLKGMGGKAKALNDALFRFNGTRYITNVVRTWATAIGQEHLIDLARADTPKAREEMRHLGLRPGDIPKTAKGIFLLPRDLEAKLIKKVADARERGRTNQTAEAALARDERVRTALMRYVDESHIRPTGAVRPIASNDQAAALQLIYHLQSFMWGFWENFSKRALVLSRDAVADGKVPYEGMAQMLRLVPFALIYVFAEIIRDIIQHGMEEDPFKRGWEASDWMQYAAWTSGVFGPWEFVERMGEQGEFGNSPIEALIGPTGQWIVDGIKHDDTDAWLEKSLPFQNIIRHWMGE